MVPLVHILLNLPFCFVLFKYFHVSLYFTSIVFLSAFLFDVDHYFWCIFRNKSFSLKKCYEYHHPFPRKDKDLLHIFHTVEFYALVLILSFFIKEFLYVFIGLVYHISFDIIQGYYLLHYKNITQIKGARANSIIMWLRRHYSPSKSTK